MRIAELLDILRKYPQDWVVELAVVFPGENYEYDDFVDNYSIEAVVPWEKHDDGTRLWLVGGEDDNVDAFLDVVDE
jgi:hypothetical protein